MRRRLTPLQRCSRRILQPQTTTLQRQLECWEELRTFGFTRPSVKSIIYNWCGKIHKKWNNTSEEQGNFSQSNFIKGIKTKASLPNKLVRYSGRFLKGIQIINGPKNEETHVDTQGLAPKEWHRFCIKKKDDSPVLSNTKMHSFRNSRNIQKRAEKDELQRPAIQISNGKT